MLKFDFICYSLIIIIVIIGFLKCHHRRNLWGYEGTSTPTFLGRLRRVDLITWVRCLSVRTYVRMSVRPQKVFPIPMKFGMLVEVDE